MSQRDEAPRALVKARGASRRIGTPAVRALFVRFCREVLSFSDSVEAEVAPFEVRFADSRGFSVAVSPLRELFLVSIGRGRTCDIRVSSPESFCLALDASLRAFLEAASNGVPELSSRA